jgi:biotin carboxyl carrier protein
MKKKIIINGEEHNVHIVKKNQEQLIFELNGTEYSFDLVKKTKSHQQIQFQGKSHRVNYEKFSTDGTWQFFVDDMEAYLQLPGKVRGAKQSSSSEASLQSPMPGKIFKVLKKQGEDIKKDEAILIMEAMKMEHTIKAHKDGMIKEIFFKEGEQVQGGVKLAEIE